MLFGARREPGAVCSVPCSSQHSLMLLGSTDTSPSAQGPPLPDGKDKGREREILLKPVVKITHGQGNLSPSCSRCPSCQSYRYNETSLHLLFPPYNGKRVHCHDHCRASEPLLVPSGSLSAPVCLNLALIQIISDREIREHKNLVFPSSVEAFVPEYPGIWFSTGDFLQPS